jgi:hypothetical protein
VLRRDVYRLFGAWVELPRARDLDGVVDELHPQVAASMTAQRERLRDLLSAEVTARVEACGDSAEAHADVEALTGATPEPMGPVEGHVQQLQGLVSHAQAQLTVRLRRDGPRRVLRAFRLLFLPELDAVYGAELLEQQRARDELSLLAHASQRPFDELRAATFARTARLVDDVRSVCLERLFELGPLDRLVLEALENEARARQLDAAAWD